MGRMPACLSSAGRTIAEGCAVAQKSTCSPANWIMFPAHVRPSMRRATGHRRGVSARAAGSDLPTWPTGMYVSFSCPRVATAGGARFRHAPSVPRGRPRELRRDAGAYSATAGPVTAPGDPRGPPRERCRSRGPHGPGGCLSAPAFGDLRPGPYFGFPLRPIAGASRSHLEPLKAGSGSLPLLALCRYRSARTSWISSPPLGSPSRRRSLPREGRIDPRPVADRRRSNYAPGPSTRG